MLKKENVKDYWTKRYAQQGELTTGYVRHNKEEQEIYYEEKKDFIRHLLPYDIGTVFDFGCGKYRKMKDLFQDYIGYDIMDETDIPNVDFDTFFTANVLQHNDYKGAKDILFNANNCKYIILYEALSNGLVVESPHCVSRTVHEYQDMVFLATRKKLITFRTHLIHGQLHGLMIFI